MKAVTSRPGTRLTDEQRLAWLRLIRSENVGPATFRQLINRYGSANEALQRLPELVRKGGKRSIRIESTERAERERDYATRLGACFVALGEPDYPRALMAADSPPPLLAVIGSTEVLVQRSAGFVGSRNASMAGAKLTGRIASEVGRNGYTVVSGLARGIDAAAHRASLGTGTVACMAGGLDKPYPPQNVPLMREIVERGGAVVSEMPFGWTPRARDFPRRNRLIAGLSLGIVVVEAAHRSGSLITARLANEMGRLVFAVPGSPLDPRAGGTNALLKQGASILTEASDIIEALEPLTDPPLRDEPQLFDATDDKFDARADEPATTDRERIIEALGPTPTQVDELTAYAEVHPAIVQTVLLELELAGRLERHSGGHVSLILTDL